MKKIIIDCDNTFGVMGCDIDDGMAIIYSLAEENVELLGVTTTFGNNRLEVVYPNTKEFMENIKQKNIPVYRGEYEDYDNNQAAKYLVEMAKKYKGELILIGTGSLTNLYHAYLLDNEFYENLSEIGLMGGISQPLIINGKRLNELNFSCHNEAALNVLSKGKNISIGTGNVCLDAFFTVERFEELKKGNEFEKWLYEKSGYWFKREKDIFENDGIYIWDIYPIAAILNEKLFDRKVVEICPDETSMKEGLLFGKGSKNMVNIPELKDSQAYLDKVYENIRKYGEMIKDK